MILVSLLGLLWRLWRGIFFPFGYFLVSNFFCLWVLFRFLLWQKRVIWNRTALHTIFTYKVKMSAIRVSPFFGGGWYVGTEKYQCSQYSWITNTGMVFWFSSHISEFWGHIIPYGENFWGAGGNYFFRGILKKWDFFYSDIRDFPNLEFLENLNSNNSMVFRSVFVFKPDYFFLTYPNLSCQAIYFWVASHSHLGNK